MSLAADSMQDYPGCQWLFSHSHLSHVTRLLCPPSMLTCRIRIPRTDSLRGPCGVLIEGLDTPTAPPWKPFCSLSRLYLVHRCFLRDLSNTAAVIFVIVLFTFTILSLQLEIIAAESHFLWGSVGFDIMAVYSTALKHFTFFLRLLDWTSPSGSQSNGIAKRDHEFIKRRTHISWCICYSAGCETSWLFTCKPCVCLCY